jgi:hypothetical protein
MAIRVVEFSRGGTKLERINVPNKRKLLNFEFWFNGKLSKIGHLFSYKKIILSKNVNNKKRAPKLVFFNEKKMRKIRMIFDIGNWHSLTARR